MILRQSDFRPRADFYLDLYDPEERPDDIVSSYVVTAPAEVQRNRVLKRPGMSADKLDALLANQMADKEKRERADFVVDTNRSLEETAAEIDRIIESLRGREGTAFRHTDGNGAETSR